MADDRLKIWIGFLQFFLGSIVLGAVTLLVNNRIQEREVELKEQDLVGKFLDHALKEDVGVRHRFASYFATVTRSDTLRARWQAYSDLVDKEYAETKKEKEQLENEIKEKPNLPAIELDQKLSQIAQLKSALSPKPIVSDSVVTPRVYFHIRAAEQRAQADDLATKLASPGDVTVPGVQLVSEGPPNTELRYFRRQDQEEAKAFAARLQSENSSISS